MRRSVAGSTKDVVQRSLRPAVLDQSLVDARAARRKAARSLPLQTLRPQAAATFSPKVQAAT
ncbi:MAG: hypothetical protein ABR949_06695 [Candidatus Aquilonibacter sp.]